VLSLISKGERLLMRYSKSCSMIRWIEEQGWKDDYQEFIEIAKTKGEGWVEYMWPKPEEMQKP